MKVLFSSQWYTMFECPSGNYRSRTFQNLEEKCIAFTLYKILARSLFFIKGNFRKFEDIASNIKRPAEEFCHRVIRHDWPEACYEKKRSWPSYFQQLKIKIGKRQSKHVYF